MTVPCYGACSGIQGSDMERKTNSLRKRLVGAILVAWTCAGCVATNVTTAAGFSGLNAHTSILLMPPDIKYYRVTASGITEPIAEWTAEARTEFDSSVTAFSATHNLQLARIEQAELSAEAAQYDQLHAAVGQTILANHYGPTPLPAKNAAFDWSLGDGVAGLAADTAEDYALFVHYRDYQAGGGRVGVAIFAAALGVAVYTGHQGGFASLVDLRSGDIVWFNNVPASQGDMRSPEGAQRLVKQLLADLPATLD